MTVTNGTVSNFVAVDGDTYTFDVTATTDGTVTVSVPAGGATDLATNPNLVSNTLSWIYDNTPPTVVLSGGGSGTTNTATFGVTAQFSETVYGFLDTDVTVTNGTVSNFVAVDGDTYTFDVTATTDGTVTVSVPAGGATDLATNPNLVSNTLSWIYDNTPPTVVLSGGGSGTTNTATFGVTAQFSETVYGFLDTDVTVTNGTVSNFVAVDGDTYTFDVTATTDGTVTVSVPAGGATDLATNPNLVSNTLSWIYDNTPPTVVLSGGGSGTTNTATFGVTAQFSETVYGFLDTDVTVTNGTVSNFVAVDGDTYTFDVTATTDGTVTVSVPAGGATDLATNPNLVSNTLSWIYDNTPPTVVLSGGGSGTTNTATFGVTAQFSETVYGFLDTDVTVTNGTVSNFVAVDGDTYTFDVTATTDGTVTVSVPAGGATDLATNPNLVATPCPGSTTTPRRRSSCRAAARARPTPRPSA